jgi:hypothetical protein
MINDRRGSKIAALDEHLMTFKIDFQLILRRGEEVRRAGLNQKQGAKLRCT